MSAALPAPDGPVTSLAGAIARMEAIGSALPAGDGLACFNRMYLDVTSQVNSELGQGFYADPAFMTELDVTFANLYFAAADTAGNPAAVPLAWRPLVERRGAAGIEPIQFALAGMNVHINTARDLAWTNTRLLWAVRDNPLARGLLLDSLAASTALASRMLLVAV